MTAQNITVTYPESHVSPWYTVGHSMELWRGVEEKILNKLRALGYDAGPCPDVGAWGAIIITLPEIDKP